MEINSFTFHRSLFFNHNKNSKKIFFFMNLLEIAILPGKGRGYKALTDIPAGTTIHVSEPLATTVSQEWTPETCMWCFHFSYPKKQKVKAVDDQERNLLVEKWNLVSASNKKKKNSNGAPLFKDMLFCSEGCKLKFKSYGYHPEEWNTLLAIYYRLDEEFKNSNTYEIDVPPPSSSVKEKNHTKWIDMDDDKALSKWVSDAWETLTKGLGHYREMEDVDKCMCRLIAACISCKHGEEQANISATSLAEEDATAFTKFNDLLVIQNNELTHFKSHFNTTLYPHHQNQLPIINNKEDYLSIIPSEVLEVMALYSFFARALCALNSSVPSLTNVDHHLFRSIYFRENANSFGLWEMGNNDITNADGGVADDLELLGWGIYPSAVYFNHSCDANVIKVREGRNMIFITRHMINKGEEACISYGSVGEDVESRRSRLLEHYHFLCNCTRCIEDSLHHKMVEPPR
jgi:hypothetical protein